MSLHQEGNRWQHIHTHFYVDDMLLASKNSYELDGIQAKLHEAFDIKDLGHASHILGMCITCDRSKKLLWLL